MVSAAAPACPLPYGQSPRRRPLLGTLQRLVNSFKFVDRHDTRRLFGNWLHQAGQELIAEADLLVPVALTGMRLLHRRFDQAAIIAQEISRRSGLPVRTKILTRTRRTKTAGRSDRGAAPPERPRLLSRTHARAALYP